MIMQLLGKDYDHAVNFEDRFLEYSDLEQRSAELEAENDY